MESQEVQWWADADRALQALLERSDTPTVADVEALELSQPVRQRLQLLVDALADPRRLDGDKLWFGENTNEAALMTGRTVDNWELGSLIGQGGSSVVYAAIRTDTDYSHRVALKLLKFAGFGSDGSDRFVREQKILAQLEHPGIARFIDGGLADDGTPYIAMELIDGEPIDHYVENQKLATRPIIRLFLEVGEAVAFAHTHLIVHRDIKPSNILVDANGRARLLDFGIARLLAEDGDRTATRIMTPEYAAPEQLQGDRITTATDCFGLGTTLQQLLSGHRLDRDMRNILNKATVEDPLLRYQSARELSDDLNRYLNGQPVSAVGPSMGYQLRKFLSRHRWGVISSVSVAAALVAVVGFYTQQLRQEKDRAQAEAEVANQLTRQLTDLIVSTDPTTQAGRPVTTLTLLEQQVAQLENASLEPNIKAEIYSAIGGAYHGMSRFEESRRTLQKAVQIYRAEYPSGHSSLAASIEQLAWSQLELGGDYLEALESFTQSAEMFGDLNLPLKRADALHGQALALNGAKRKSEAEQVMLEVLATRQNELGLMHPKVAHSYKDMGIVLRYARRYIEAERSLRTALDIQRELFEPTDYELSSTLHLLGLILADQANNEAAEDALSEALSIAQLTLNDDHHLTQKIQASLTKLHNSTPEDKALD